MSLKVKASGTTLKVWLSGSLKINKTTSTATSGGIGLTGEDPKFRNITVGYDNSADDDIADAGDDMVYADDFTTTQVSSTHDNNGNLTDNGTFKYVYDAWNRLVEATTQEDGLTVMKEVEYDAKGRRLKKVVSNSSDFDGPRYTCMMAGRSSRLGTVPAMFGSSSFTGPSTSTSWS